MNLRLHVIQRVSWTAGANVPTESVPKTCLEVDYTSTILE